MRGVKTMLGTETAVIISQLKLHRWQLAMLGAMAVFAEIVLMDASWDTAKAVVCTFFMIPASVLDSIYYRLYHKLTLPMVAVGLLLAVATELLGQQGSMWEAVGGSICFGGLLLAVYMLVRGGMGFGDVCYGFALGTFLDVERALLAFTLAFCLGALMACRIYLCRMAGYGPRVKFLPLGPFLAAGTFIGFVWGQELVAWYVSLL